MPNRSYADLPPSDGYLGVPDRGEIEVLAAPQDPLPVAFASQYAVVVNDTVRFPNGKTGSYMRIFHPAELAGRHGTVMLTRKDGGYVMLRLFRHPTRSWEIECPRGFAEPDLSAEENARKEIREEMNVGVVSLTPLGEICPNTGMLVTRAHVFLVELDALPVGINEDQASEAIAHFPVFSREELLAAIARGEIRDAFTLGAITLALASGQL